MNNAVVTTSTIKREQKRCYPAFVSEISTFNPMMKEKTEEINIQLQPVIASSPKPNYNLLLLIAGVIVCCCLICVFPFMLTFVFGNNNCEFILKSKLSTLRLYLKG